MKLVKISKASPDQSAVHVLGNGRVKAAKIRGPKFKAAVRRSR